MTCEKCLMFTHCRYDLERNGEPCEHFIDTTIKTNYDRIRGMSVEEVAKWLSNNITTHSMPKEVRRIWISGKMTTTQAWKQYLESEVEGE